MVQVVEMTKEEQIKMYMKIKKTKLVEMLIECNRCLSLTNPIIKQGKFAKI